MALRTRAYFFFASALALLLMASTASAALTPASAPMDDAPTNCPAAGDPSGTCTAGQPCNNQGKIMTIYVPHSAPNCATSIEGCIATSRKSLTGHCVPMTVDCVRLGKCQYATCASDPSNYGKYFNLGSVTYRSALDMQMYTVPNVTCYVHDTGGAFRGRPDKLDLATTVCPTCNDAQAGAIARNAKVDLTNTGITDRPGGVVSSPTPVGYPQTIGQASANPVPSYSPSASAQPTAAQSPASIPSTIQPYIPSSASNIALPATSTASSTYFSSVSDLFSSLFATQAATKTQQAVDVSALSAQKISQIQPSQIVQAITAPSVNGYIAGSSNSFISQDMSGAPALESQVSIVGAILTQVKNILASVISFLTK